MYRMLFPRLLAVAERAWHKASWESILDKPKRALERSSNWVQFANTVVYRELSRLDALGIAYHVTPPGARLAFSSYLGYQGWRKIGSGLL